MDFIQELGSKKVLSNEDIFLLKEYIGKKYINHSKTQKSNILAKAVHQVLDKNIRGLKKEYNQTIKQDLLKNTILKDGHDILLIDILNSCITMKDPEDDFFESVIDWVNLHVETKVSQTDLEKYSFKLSDLKENSSIAILTEQYVEDMAEVGKLKSTINFRMILLVFFLFIAFASLLQYNYKMKDSFEFKKVQSDHSITITEDIEETTEAVGITTTTITETNPIPTVISNLPEHFNYKEINQIVLKSFLTEQNSLLVEEPYFSTIISVSKEYNLNPFVLFAITGQEQGFVPKDNSFAKEIANNPFNVYHSWRRYNTDIEDASRIVCRTIINLSKDRPQDAEPFEWINRKYAEDQNWFKGVSAIYNKIEKYEVE